MLVYIWYQGQDKLAYKVKDGTKFNHYVLIGDNKEASAILEQFKRAMEKL